MMTYFVSDVKRDWGLGKVIGDEPGQAETLSSQRNIGKSYSHALYDMNYLQGTQSRRDHRDNVSTLFQWQTIGRSPKVVHSRKHLVFLGMLVKMQNSWVESLEWMGKGGRA